jgi:hypothetical protein
MKQIKSIISLVFIVFVLQLNAQTPDNYPPVNPEPIDFNLFNIVLYILLPMLLIIGYLLYRRSRKKAEKKKEEESKN